MLKIFFSSLMRDVLELCFRSVRFGYFFFFPFLPFLAALSEPRSSPVASSMSRISSGSRHSAEKVFFQMKFSLQANCVQNTAAQYAYTFELYRMSSCVYQYTHTHTYHIYIFIWAFIHMCTDFSKSPNLPILICK